MTDNLNLFTLESGLTDLARATRNISSLAASQHSPKLTIAVLSNFSSQFLAQSMRTSFLNANFNVMIHENVFDQWELELRNAESITNSKPFDFLLIFLSSTRLILNPQARDITFFVNNLSELISKYKQKSSSKIIIIVPEYLEESKDPTSVFFSWVEDLRRQMMTALADLVTFVPIDSIVSEFGSGRWFSKKFLINSKFSCHPNCYPVLGNYIVKQILAMIRPSAKLIIIDLDNTLWGGVVGELGWDGVDLNIDSAGYSHLMLQRYLLGLKESGVLLALCSKNDLVMAKEVFEKRPEMILKWNDFVATEVNWALKSKNIRNILENLNLSSAGIVFIDDSKFERAEVRNSHPDIFVPDLSENVGEWCLQLASSGRMSIMRKTIPEDKTEQYLIEQQRNVSAKTYPTYHDFLASLDLTLLPEKISDDNIDRVVELIHKTNQFNLKTKRISASELRSILTDETVFGYSYRLRDRFSDYGIIAVFIANQMLTQEGQWEIHTWLMSCRAMGRSVENAVFFHFISQMKSGSTILGEFIETPKNGPIAGLLVEMNFEGTSNKKKFTVGKNLVSLPAHIQLTS